MLNKRSTSVSVRAAVGSSMIRMRAFKRQRLRDLDALAVADGQRADFARDVQVMDVQRGQQLDGFVAHGGPADRAQRVEWGVAHKDVLGDGQLRVEQQFLVDGGDAVALGIIGVAETHGFPVDDDLTGIGLINARRDLDQGGFTRAIFAQQGVDFSRADVELNVIQGLNPRKRLGDVF